MVEDQKRQSGAGHEEGAVDGQGSHAAASLRHQFRVGGQAADPDQHPQQKSHREGQNDDPRDGQQHHPGDLRQGRASPHEEIRQDEERADEEEERVGGEAEERRRPDLSQDRAGDQAHEWIVGSRETGVKREAGGRAGLRWTPYRGHCSVR
jgi:hypothetical protein